MTLVQPERTQAETLWNRSLPQLPEVNWSRAQDMAGENRQYYFWTLKHRIYPTKGFHKTRIFNDFQFTLPLHRSTGVLVLSRFHFHAADFLPQPTRCSTGGSVALPQQETEPPKARNTRRPPGQLLPWDAAWVGTQLYTSPADLSEGKITAQRALQERETESQRGVSTCLQRPSSGLSHLPPACPASLLMDWLLPPATGTTQLTEILGGCVVPLPITYVAKILAEKLMPTQGPVTCGNESMMGGHWIWSLLPTDSCTVCWGEPPLSDLRFPSAKWEYKSHFSYLAGFGNNVEKMCCIHNPITLVSKNHRNKLGGMKLPFWKVLLLLIFHF